MQLLPRHTKYNTLYISAFTLVELLVVISIISVLASIVVVSFRSSQTKGRDAERKNDLKQINNALELYYSDYGKYPDSLGGQIVGCNGSSCSWGSGSFTDGKTVYMKVLPKDPISGSNYYYKTVTINGATNQGFQLYARLENTQDQGCLNGAQGTPDCSNPVGLPGGVSCGTKTCNFSITSPNTTPTE